MNTRVWVKNRGHNVGVVQTAGGGHDKDGSAASTALWIFMGVVASLFSLFIASYVMRMEASDWHPIAMPWQLWFSTLLLAAASASLQLASVAAQRARREQLRQLLLAAGVCSLAFLCVQLWAWSALLAAQVTPVGNPAGSFFFLLTAMHGLHVTGGLVAWGVTACRTWKNDMPGEHGRIVWPIALCERTDIVIAENDVR